MDGSKLSKSTAFIVIIFLMSIISIGIGAFAILNPSVGSVGPEGPPGQDGIDGIDGVNGTNGIDGIDGTNGINGVDGTDGTDGIIQTMQSIGSGQVSTSMPITWVTISNLQLVIDCQNNSKLHISFFMTLEFDESNIDNISIRIRIDTTELGRIGIANIDGTEVVRIPVSMTIISDPVTAGFHQVQVQWSGYSTPPDFVYSPSGFTRCLTVMELIS
jgi:hypothetical protein